MHKKDCKQKILSDLLINKLRYCFPVSERIGENQNNKLNINKKCLFSPLRQFLIRRDDFSFNFLYARNFERYNIIIGSAETIITITSIQILYFELNVD